MAIVTMFMMMMVQMMMTMMMKPMTGGSALPSNLRQVLADDGPICSYQHWPADPPHDCDEFIQSKVFTIFLGPQKTLVVCLSPLCEFSPL